MSKRRGSEKRKEKSRDAARCRRSKESEVFASLLAQLPQCCMQCHGQQIDKASIMRLAISYLKLHGLVHKVKDDDGVSLAKVEDEYDSLKAVNGFVMVVLMCGDIIYVSENVSRFLGIPQVELIGQSLFDFTHPCERAEVSKLLSSGKGNVPNISIRMKSTITSKGRSVNLKSAAYKVVQCFGHYFSTPGVPKTSALSLVCSLLPDLSSTDIVLNSDMFVTKHSLDMRVTYCDEHVSKLLGYQKNDLLNKSMYELYHAQDGEQMTSTFKQLFNMGQTASEPYRLLAKNGGYVWAVTQATVLHDTEKCRPFAVLCVHQIISEVTENHEVLSTNQLPYPKEMELGNTVMSTETVFCPISEIEDYDSNDANFDINSEDLIHLAPNAGDVCIPLAFPFPPGPSNDDVIALRDDNLKTVPKLELLSGTESCFAPLDTSPEPKPTNWQPLSIDIDDDSDSIGYPASEGFSTHEDSDISAQSTPARFLSPASELQTSPAIFEYRERDAFDSLDDVDLEMRAPFIPPDDDWMFSPVESFPLDSLLITAGMNFPSSDPLMSGASVDRFFPPVLYKPVVNNRKLPLQECDAMGDPPLKVARTDQPLARPKEPPKMNSVLKNLLVCGEDRNYGYCLSKAKQMLPCVTQNDAEVNAPISQSSLLAGEDLLAALDANAY